MLNPDIESRSSFITSFANIFQCLDNSRNKNELFILNFGLLNKQVNVKIITVPSTRNMHYV